jgi:hypothetical protein
VESRETSGSEEAEGGTSFARRHQEGRFSELDEVAIAPRGSDTQSETTDKAG